MYWSPVEARRVFYHGGYWVITRNFTDGSLCYFYSRDGTSWSEPRQIEPVGDYYGGWGAAVSKESHPSPYVHIAYYGLDRNIYYRRGVVNPGDGTISWEDRTLVEEDTQGEWFSDVVPEICVSGGNVYLFYKTINSSTEWRVRCLNTGFYFDPPDAYKEDEKDKQMAPLPDGRVAILGYIYASELGVFYRLITVSPSGGVVREEICSFSTAVSGLNIVYSGKRPYVTFSWEDVTGIMHVSVYTRLPDRWAEVYRSPGEYTYGSPAPASLTATPSGGLVLFYLSEYGSTGFTKVVMVRSPDGLSWGEEEEVFQIGSDEYCVLSCDSPRYADAGKVPVVFRTYTTDFKYRIWFWKTEVPLPPPPPPREGVTPLYGASVSFTTWMGSGGQERTSFTLGENCAFRVTVVDAARRPVEDAVVLIRIGSLQLPVNYLGNGVYEAVLDTSLLGEGTFTVNVSVGALGYVSPQPQSFTISVSGVSPKARIPDWLSAAAVLSGAAVAALLTRRRE
jgi:hypothetical protein